MNLTEPYTTSCLGVHDSQCANEIEPVAVMSHVIVLDSIVPLAMAFVFAVMFVVLLPMFQVFEDIFEALVLILVSCASFLALIRLGNATRLAHVPPVSVQASNSALVASSTLPATVSLAFGVVPVALSTHDHHT